MVVMLSEEYLEFMACSKLLHFQKVKM